MPHGGACAAAHIDALIRLYVVAGRTSEGGPVVDVEGRVSGMLVFGPRRGALVIPSATIERVAAHLLAKGRVALSYLGLGLRPIRLAEAGTRGLIVVSIDPDGPAHKAGMFIGDVVTTWNGEAIGGMRRPDAPSRVPMPSARRSRSGSCGLVPMSKSR